MRVEIQTYSGPCGVLSVYGVFFFKMFSNVIFCNMSKTFLWGLHFIFCVFELKQSKLQKQTFSKCDHQFSRQIFPLSNVTMRQQPVRQLDDYFRDVEHLIWTHPRDFDLANESVHLSRKRTSCTTILLMIKNLSCCQALSIRKKSSPFSKLLNCGGDFVQHIVRKDQGRPGVFCIRYFGIFNIRCRVF